MTENRACFICESRDVVYADAIGLDWCRVCYDDIYRGAK